MLIIQEFSNFTIRTDYRSKLPIFLIIGNLTGNDKFSPNLISKIILKLNKKVNNLNVPLYLNNFRIFFIPNLNFDSMNKKFDEDFNLHFDKKNKSQCFESCSSKIISNLYQVN